MTDMSTKRRRVVGIIILSLGLIAGLLCRMEDGLWAITLGKEPSILAAMVGS